MQAAPTRVREHQVVFCGLEVLRLIGERMENENHVDGEDLEAVFTFMRDIRHRCLDNTEEILRLACLEQNVLKHQQARLLFEELTQAQGMAFVSTCRRY